jgi:hypothetical protein
MNALLSSVAALDGGQGLTDVEPAALASYAEYLCMALRYAWNWAEWPELNRVRQRTPQSGLITWSEAGQPMMGTVYAVTLDDPNQTRNPRGVQWRHDSNGGGVRVFNLTDGGSVFVRHTRTAPLVTTQLRDNTVNYALDDVVYDADSGQCYECCQAGSGHAVTDEAWWRAVELPFILKLALARGAYALKTGAGGQKQTETLLKQSMDELLAMEIDQFRNRSGQHQTFAVVNS